MMRPIRFPVRFLKATKQLSLVFALSAMGVITAQAAGEAMGRARAGAVTDSAGHVRIPIQVKKDLKIVYQVSDDKLKGESGRALVYAKKLLDTYNANDVPDEEIDLHLVFHGDAIKALVNDSTRKRLKAEGAAGNPNKSLIKELNKRGVSIELCESTMEQKEVKSTDLVDGVATVRGAFPRIINLQHLGYAYIKFE
ncbi:DsrE family protein [Luteolibacter sp. AS25]|uniref:DsrE family protein n=1 Tax=Luteolibacter sp. AS25 TaxID=3135776 RepID=UPI00398AEF0F